MPTVAPLALGNVIDGLITTLRAADGFKDPLLAGTDVPVFDGLIVTGDRMFEALVVGGDGGGMAEGPQRPGRFQSAWGPTNMTLEERGTVQCAVVVWGGESDYGINATQRTRVVDLLAAVDVALRSSIAAAALGVTELLWCHIAGGEIVQMPTDAGTETRYPFTVDYSAYLTVT